MTVRVATAVGVVGVALAAFAAGRLVLATLFGSPEDVAEVAASMIESSVHAAVAGALGLGFLGAFGGPLVKAYGEGL